jgi:hypothetical protein
VPKVLKVEKQRDGLTAQGERLRDRKGKTGVLEYWVKTVSYKP